VHLEDQLSPQTVTEYDAHFLAIQECISALEQKVDPLLTLLGSHQQLESMVAAMCGSLKVPISLSSSSSAVPITLPFSPSLPSLVQNLQGMSLNVNANRAQSNASCASSANSSMRSGQLGMFSVSSTCIWLTCSSLGLSVDWHCAYLWPW